MGNGVDDKVKFLREWSKHVRCEPDLETGELVCKIPESMLSKAEELFKPRRIVFEVEAPDAKDPKGP